MSDGSVISFAATIFERDDLFVFALLDDFRRHFAFAVRDVFSIHVHQYFEGRGFTRRDIEKIDINRVAFRDAILPATAFDNCVSHTGTFEIVWGNEARKSHGSARLASAYYRPEIRSTISPFGGFAS